MEFIKVVGSCYKKMVKEFIPECNFEGCKEYRKVYDRGKCVKLSPPIIDDYMGRIKVTSIDKIMTKE